jgi:hypothetical protein
VFATVPGVPATPPTSGLVASAVRPDPADLPGWEDGLAWVPERCGSAYQLVPRCADAPGGFVPSRPDAAYHQPVGLRVADECTTLAGPLDLERARRLAEAVTPFAVAREAWSGTGTLADLYPADVVAITGGQNANARLASAAATEVGASAASARVAIGRLEQTAVETSRGQQVHLHVPIRLLPQLDGYVFRGPGGVLYTLAGNVVVADPGYPGTGPAGQAVGATAWAYATSPVQVLLSPLSPITDDSVVVDRAVNTRTVWAARVFAATWDPCVHLATEITI